MQLKHLSDEEIQDYLDGNLSEETALRAKGHLQVCQRCREALKQYESLYVGLQGEKGFELSKGFAQAVLRRLPAEGEAESRFSFVNTLLVVLGIIISLGATLYYVDLRPLGRAFSHLLPKSQVGLELLDLIEGILLGLNGNLGLLVIAVLALLIMGVLDRIIFQPKYRRVSF
jgi:anti-sigma factor RsiW